MTEITEISLEDKTEEVWIYSTDTNTTFISIAIASLVKTVSKITYE